MIEKATFAAGCFWGVEAAFQKIKGVQKTTVGYMGGDSENPTYEDVCTDKTGHAEVVQIEYETDKISYEDLLNAFWSIHDPTQKNRQGPDRGTQYRSAIFYHNQEQKKAAEQSKAMLKKSGKYKNTIATEINPARKFFRAEEYHQNYLKKNRILGCKT